MITPVLLTWRERRGTYRPVGEPLDTRLYEVAAIPDDKTARVFVEANHYSGTYPAARFRFGLYFCGLLVGIAVFSVPMQARVFDPLYPLDVLSGPLRDDGSFTSGGGGNLVVIPGDPRQHVELGRLVLLDSVPSNAESWFVSRCFELLYHREDVIAVVSFSDPFPRDNASGERVFKGHIGTIYQSLNAVHAGRATARTLRLLPDGTVFSDRAIQKIRAQERGHEYAEEILERLGAPRCDGDPATWLRTWLPRVTRTARHPGNIRYLFGLDRRVRKYLPASLPYPKFQPGIGLIEA